MKNIIDEILLLKIKSCKTIETNRILEAVELKMGERFELTGGYFKFAAIIIEMSKDGHIIPVKKSGNNGRNPALYSKYRLLESQKLEGRNPYNDEILSLHPKLNKNYFLKNTKQYMDYREDVLKLNSFLTNPNTLKELNFRCTMNERSFEIFNHEKFLDEYGTAFLKRLGLTLNDLNCYKTYEAFFYYSVVPGQRGDALIIENRDTFMSLIQRINDLCSIPVALEGINILIFGGGEKIISSFKFMDELSISTPVDKVYYFGDLDYPGIDIYQRLSRYYGPYEIIPQVTLYKRLIDLVPEPPVARNDEEADIERFLSFFDEEYSNKIRLMLENRNFIPQEGLSFAKGSI